MCKYDRDVRRYFAVIAVLLFAASSGFAAPLEYAVVRIIVPAEDSQVESPIAVAHASGASAASRRDEVDAIAMAPGLFSSDDVVLIPADSALEPQSEGQDSGLGDFLSRIFPLWSSDSDADVPAPPSASRQRQVALESPFDGDGLIFRVGRGLKSMPTPEDDEVALDPRSAGDEDEYEDSVRESRVLEDVHDNQRRRRSAPPGGAHDDVQLEDEVEDGDGEGAPGPRGQARAGSRADATPAPGPLGQLQALAGTAGEGEAMAGFFTAYLMPASAAQSLGQQIAGMIPGGVPQLSGVSGR